MFCFCVNRNAPQGGRFPLQFNHLAHLLFLLSQTILAIRHGALGINVPKNAMLGHKFAPECATIHLFALDIILNQECAMNNHAKVARISLFIIIYNHKLSFIIIHYH